MIAELENRLLKRKINGNYRQLQLSQQLIDFSSSDYLGLARSSKLHSAVTEELKMHQSHFNGFGSTGSRLLTGNSIYAQNLEDRLAKFHGYDAGLLFSCGYMANVGLLSTVATVHDTILFDSEIHASTHDGLRLSRARAFPFRHNDLEHLENRLKGCSIKGNRFLCIESIYSMDGSKAPLPQIWQLADKYKALLIVDEAHAVGVCGPQGRGLVAEHNLTSQVFAQVTTFGKAIGAYGAIVLGSHTLKQALINFATSYIYTTALPLQSLAAIKCSYDLFPLLEDERQHIHSLIQLFQKEFQGDCSISHIQPIPINGNDAAKNAAENLKNNHFDVRALLSPTVRRRHEILRICLHVYNTKREVSILIALIKTLRRHHG